MPPRFEDNPTSLAALEAEVLTLREALADHEIVVFNENERKMLESRLVRPKWEIGDICFMSMPRSKKKRHFKAGATT